MASNVRHTLPLRFRILHYASTHDTFTYLDLMRDLKAEYPKDGQMNRKIMTLHMDSFRAVGMTEEVNVELENDQGDLLITYRLTDFGRSRLRYLPQAWQEYKG